MIRIITDSAADFEMHEYEKMDVVCIPLCVRREELNPIWF